MFGAKLALCAIACSPLHGTCCMRMRMHSCPCLHGFRAGLQLSDVLLSSNQTNIYSSRGGAPTYLQQQNQTLISGTLTVEADTK